MKNKKMNFKETLAIIGISLLATPLVYQIVFAQMGWWL